jgi:hypothetical protein
MQPHSAHPSIAAYCLRDLPSAPPGRLAATPLAVAATAGPHVALLSTLPLH